MKWSPFPTKYLTVLNHNEALGMNFMLCFCLFHLTVLVLQRNATTYQLPDDLQPPIEESYVSQKEYVSNQMTVIVVMSS